MTVYFVLYDGDFFGTYPKQYFDNWMTWLLDVGGITVYSVKID
jgi:hypothetical protein